MSQFNKPVSSISGFINKIGELVNYGELYLNYGIRLVVYTVNFADESSGRLISRQIVVELDFGIYKLIPGE